MTSTPTSYWKWTTMIYLSHSKAVGVGVSYQQCICIVGTPCLFGCLEERISNHSWVRTWGTNLDFPKESPACQVGLVLLSGHGKNWVGNQCALWSCSYLGGRDALKSGNSGTQHLSWHFWRTWKSSWVNAGTCVWSLLKKWQSAVTYPVCQPEPHTANYSFQFVYDRAH